MSRITEMWTEDKATRWALSFPTYSPVSPSFRGTGQCAERDGAGKQRIDPGISVWKLQAPRKLPPHTSFPTSQPRNLWEISEAPPISEALAFTQANPALGGADSRARRAGERSTGRSKTSRGFLRPWTPGPRKKAPDEGAEKAPSMGKVGLSPELGDRPNDLDAKCQHIHAAKEAEETGAWDQARHPRCPPAQAHSDPRSSPVTPISRVPSCDSAGAVAKGADKMSLLLLGAR